MEIAEQAALWSERIAADDSHGYQWGGWGPDYDCGHLVIMAYENAGIPLRAHGASYTGNLPEAALACGAKDVTAQVDLATGAGMRRGDILVNRQNHAAMFVGSGMIVQARSNYDGIPGDSSGQEIRKQGYYNYPWTHVLRFEETGSDNNIPATPSPDADNPSPGQETPAYIYHSFTYEVSVNLLKIGDYGPQVANMQRLLAAHGFDPGKIDGKFGELSFAALKAFQTAAGIGVDGEWGGESFNAMWNY